jgi:hypothetical protein
MGLSQKDRKMLWARSGNRCAFPTCTQLLVETDAEESAGIVIGEEAHIVAREREGPRGEESIIGSVDAYLNHILLCPTHHRKIDEQPLTFTVGVLRAMRRDHEARVRAEQALDSPPAELPTAAYDGMGFGIPIIAWKFRATIIVVYSFGSPPFRAPTGHLSGSGFQFVEHKLSDEPAVLLNSSEAQPDIEFWVDRSVLYVIQQTFDIDTKGFIPLAEHRIDAGTNPLRHSISNLLKSAASPPYTLEQVALDLESVGRPGSQTAEVLLYRLRNAGIRRPGEALAILERMKNAPWYDGANAECGNDIERDLELAKTFSG